MGAGLRRGEGGMGKFIPTTPLWRRLQNKRGVRHGTMGEILTTLPDETVSWLFDITPEGASIADTIRSLVVDARHE